ncbi:hypothetical protein CSC80_10705 [Maribacter sp. 6B07]|uniref:carboxypeptidase-like regulatory domain-containing protein n=1 Tax=Maribacter sp. 6B07 TaxID=2045442 RepID=UPI000C07BC96|nr:carboxypeptidase-like regulatory domain-containing protein [Maribacter sp. 6B07]PHN93389.1 hypothetical protein CSC80_10705 [Maribacter sp. 6B07]
MKINWNNIFRVDAIIGIIIAIGTVFIWIRSCNEKPQIEQLTIFVTDTLGNSVLENQGRINIPLGNRSLNETIGVNGRTNFPDITSNSIGDTLKIGLEAQGWEVVDKNKVFIFNGKPIILEVKRDESLGTIKGLVRSKSGESFIADASIYINADTLIYTNSNGQFKTVLPYWYRVSSISDYYNLTIKKSGFKSKTEIYYPNTMMEIRLEPLQ